MQNPGPQASTVNGFSYLSLVTDAYSRKISSYCLYESLEATGCEGALFMALKSRVNLNGELPLIHHSDQGATSYKNYYLSGT